MRHGLVLSVLVLIGWAGAACADIPSPDGTPNHRPWGPGPPPHGWHNPEHVRVAIPLIVDPAVGDDRQTRLRLPGSLVKRLRSGAGVFDEWRRGWAPTPTGTVVAGAALSAALVLGGFWLIRRRPRRWIGGAVAAATVVVVVGVSGCPLPTSDWWRYPTYQVEEPLKTLQVQPGNVLAGKARLEVGDKDDSIRLTINQEDLAEWAGTASGQAADGDAEPGAATK